MLSCITDGDFDKMVELSEELVSSVTPHRCVECKATMPPGELHYEVILFKFDEDGEQYDLPTRFCCEVCGDLALSFLELGYCWCFGDLRADIQETNEL